MTKIERAYSLQDELGFAIATYRKEWQEVLDKIRKIENKNNEKLSERSKPTER